MVLGPLAVFAWTSAPSTPPNSNVDMPLNVGNSNQSKIGNLLLNSGNNQTALIIYGGDSSHGLVGIGNITTPSYKLQVGTAGDGSAVGASAFFYSSDSRLKDQIVTLPDALRKVMSLRGVQYAWKSTGQSDIGLIAQEVEKVYPQVVHTGNDGMKSVDYGHLVGPLVEAIKAQQKTIDTLQGRVQRLEALVNTLKK